jgi:hypothetical protein
MPLSKRLPEFALAALAFSGVPAVGASIYCEQTSDGMLRMTDRPDNPRSRPCWTEPGQRPDTQPGHAEIHQVVASVAAARKVDAALLHAVIQVESAYNRQAVSPKGASGLMQLMPATAQRYGVKNTFDAAENIDAGARYLRDLLDLFDNNLPLAVAAYNAGENAVLRFGRRVPPYAETRAYVPRVLERYRVLRNSTGP